MKRFLLNRKQMRIFLLLLVFICATAIAFSSGPEIRVINDDAGWCWFEDERAIFQDGKLIAGSVAAGPGDESRKGNIEVSSMDLETGEVEQFVLHGNLESDDHDSPGNIP